MKHIIVTGGAGFIGSHLCDSLLSKGYAVTAIDNLVTGREENLEYAKKNPSFRYLKWDVCQALPESKIEFLNQLGLHGIFHFACPASPVDFDRIPFDILAVDSLGTMHTVDLAFRFKARYLLASTSEVYGDPLEHPQKETYWGNVNSVGPRACYDETKRFAEAYVSSAIRGQGTYRGNAFQPLNAGIVRIFNTYGPRMRPDDGRVVPELCLQALKGENLTIHGDGQQTRSFCYVSDLVDGILRLFESEIKHPVNIGNPVERTIYDFAVAVQNCVGGNGVGKSQITKLEARPDDPKKRRPDITLARTLLKWEPKVSLEEGLARTVEYFKTQIK